MFRVQGFRTSSLPTLTKPSSSKKGRNTWPGVLDPESGKDYSTFTVPCCAMVQLCGTARFTRNRYIV